VIRRDPNGTQGRATFEVFCGQREPTCSVVRISETVDPPPHCFSPLTTETDALFNDAGTVVVVQVPTQFGRRLLLTATRPGGESAKAEHTHTNTNPVDAEGSAEK
jgi:hypothetical protein